jgi:hypothetical protein
MVVEMIASPGASAERTGLRPRAGEVSVPAHESLELLSGPAKPGGRRALRDAKGRCDLVYREALDLKQDEHSTCVRPHVAEQAVQELASVFLVDEVVWPRQGRRVAVGVVGPDLPVRLAPKAESDSRRGGVEKRALAAFDDVRQGLQRDQKRVLRGVVGRMRVHAHPAQSSADAPVVPGKHRPKARAVRVGRARFQSRMAV